MATLEEIKNFKPTFDNRGMLVTEKSPDINIDLNKPTLSSDLGQVSPSNFDILAEIKKNQTKQDSLFSQITGYFTPSPEEITAQQELTGIRKQGVDVSEKMDTAQLNLQDELGALELPPEGANQPYTTGFSTRSQAEAERRANVTLSRLGVQQGALARREQVALATLQNAQSNRGQKLEAAKFLYDANRNSLQDTLNLYKATVPENVGTFTNKQTGDVFVSLRNPVTGQVTSQKVGNVGADKAYSSSSTIQDSKGNYYFVGVKQDGSVDTINLGIQGSAKEDKFLQFEETDDFGNQSTVYINPATGTRITSNGIYSSELGDGNGRSRTDRNNNPTAMTTDVARVLGLKEGEDYTLGDKFPDSNLYTAKLIGDPMAVTIKALDTAAQNPSKQAFYTGGGQQRWTHTAMPDSQWLGLSPEQKQKVILDMYQRENGKNGTLFSKGSTEELDAITKATKSLSPALSEGARKAFLSNMGGLTSAGDYKTAANDLITTAINTTGVGVQEKLIGKYTAINQLSDIQQLLKEYQSKGGKTDIFTGTLEQISQKLGTTTSPELARLANRILATIVSYRQTVSGAAFTEAEANQYANLFPGIDKTPLLNEAKIESLKDSFNTDIRSTLQIRLGATNYDNLMKIIETSKTDDFIKSLYEESPESEFVKSLDSIDGLISQPIPNYSKNPNSNIG